MEAFLVLIPVGAIALATAVAVWVFRPLDKAARRRRHVTQFTLADFFCLFLVLQLTLGFNHLVLPHDEPIIYALDAFGCLCLGALWWASVRSLSAAGVRRLWHRSLFLLVVVPLTLSAAVPGVLVAVCVVAAVITDAPSDPGFWWLAAADVPLAMAVWVLGLFTRYMLARADPAAAAPEPPPPAAQPPADHAPSNQPLSDGTTGETSAP
ncbi:MAG TPA: hypothetical protein EYP56_12050 [Planctomycetaceae bacterium]|nr:hypothetical protein [Planctomycetaceae bacterium]